MQGALISVDDDGVTVRSDEPPFAERHVRFDEIERAKTVFEWKATPKPGSPSTSRSGAGGGAPKDRAAAAPKKKAAS